MQLSDLATSALLFILAWLFGFLVWLSVPTSIVLLQFTEKGSTGIVRNRYTSFSDLSFSENHLHYSRGNTSWWGIRLLSDTVPPVIFMKGNSHICQIHTTETCLSSTAHILQSECSSQYLSDTSMTPQG